MSQSKKAKVLVVDDEPDAVELIAFNLKNAGLEVVTADDGREAIRKAESTHPDLIVLDVMLPEMDGLEVCKQLRAGPETGNIPIIMLTAKAGEVDRVLGLELGADDYITKPFSPRELVLRVKNLLRRVQSEKEPKSEIRVGDLYVNVPRHEVLIKNKRIDLTATEFKLITMLIQRRGRVQSREQLLRDVWDYNTLVDTRTVDTHMRRLREKLGNTARHIETVRGIGYRFTDD